MVDSRTARKCAAIGSVAAPGESGWGAGRATKLSAEWTVGVCFFHGPTATSLFRRSFCGITLPASMQWGGKRVRIKRGGAPENLPVHATEDQTRAGHHRPGAADLGIAFAGICKPVAGGV